MNPAGSSITPSCLKCEAHSYVCEVREGWCCSWSFGLMPFCPLNCDELKWVNGFVSAGICNHLSCPVNPVKSLLAFLCASASALNDAFIWLANCVCSNDVLSPISVPVLTYLIPLQRNALFHCCCCLVWVCFHMLHHKLVAAAYKVMYHFAEKHENPLTFL